MVGVGKKSYVDERLEIAKRAGIDVRDAVPNAFALYAAYKNAYGAEGGTNMVLDIGADNMDMALVRGGKLIYARNVSTGARLFDTNVAGIANVGAEEGEWLKIRFGSLLPPADNADPKEEEIRPAIRTAAGQLAGFIQSSMNHAKIEFGDRDLVIDKIYLSGGGARLRGFPEYLQSSIKLPIELFDPFKGLDTAAAEKLGLEELRSLPTDMAVPVGLAQLALMPTEKSTLSILPDEIKRRRNFFRTWSYVAAGALMLAASLVVLTSVALVRRAGATSKREKFEADSSVQLARVSKLSQIEADQREVESKIDRVAVATLASKALLDVHAELRDFAKGEEGIMLREIRIVDPAKEDKAGRRCSLLWMVF